jgi:Rps23 Pro-64 3,4-dihydroxylase Tpa1-like proline 4-hydroxylase
MSASIRREDLGGKSLAVFDGLVSDDECKKYSATLSLADYTFLHSSRQDTVKYREWAASFSVEDFTKHALHSLALGKATEFSGIENLVCYDVFASASSFGDMSFVHHDSPDKDTVSVLYYANNEWESEWGGETLFYSDEEEPLIAVGVKPGRLVVFGGQLKHRAGVPTKVCNEVRISLSMRFRPEHCV